MSSNQHQSKRGFTIVELLIVIVVIAILAAISIVAFTGVQQRGRDAQRASDAANIVKALTAYTSDGNNWPADSAAAVTALNGYTTANLSTTITSKMQDGAVATNNNIQYRYQVCPAGGPVTGAQISYYKEQTSTTVAVKAGTGSCPAP